MGKLTTFGGGAIGGKLDEPAQLLFNFDDDISHSFYAGVPGVVELPSMNIHSWADRKPIAHLRLPEDQERGGSHRRQRALPAAVDRDVAVRDPRVGAEAASAPLRHHGLRVPNDAWVTGCGYAARSTTLEPSPGEFKVATFVVRLSDGYAWILPDDEQAFSWRKPLALTCDELFALVDLRPSGPGSSYFNVARLRLDALGPGIPPP